VQLPLSHSYHGNRAVAMPKLNTQFLTLHDYLLRNFLLFRLESAFQIREDLIDSIKRMGPRDAFQSTNKPSTAISRVSFGGWARMALPINAFSIDEVSDPRIGETTPSQVRCTVEVNTLRKMLSKFIALMLFHHCYT